MLHLLKPVDDDKDPIVVYSIQIYWQFDISKSFDSLVATVGLVFFPGNEYQFKGQVIETFLRMNNVQSASG